MTVHRAKQILSHLSTPRSNSNEPSSTSPSISELSILSGPKDVPLWEIPLGKLLDQRVALNGGNRDCCVSPATNGRWTYAQLQERSRHLARGLMALGIQKGDHIGILAGNCERYVELFCACGRLGAVLVVLNCTYTVPEAERALAFADCKILFTSYTIGKNNNAALINSLHSRLTSGSCNITADQKLILRHICLIREPKSEDVTSPLSGLISYEEILKMASTIPETKLSAIEATVSCHDVFNIQFTSGTTGAPKAAMLTHHNIINNGQAIGDRMRLTQEDILCCPPPLFHCFGLVLGLLACITHGSSIVFPSPTFSPAATLQAITRENCTAVHGVPAMFAAELQLARPSDFGSTRLRTGIAAGSPVPPALMKDIQQIFRMNGLTNTYGMTETSPASFMTSITDPVETRLNTVGTILPHVSAKVIDENGNIVKRGVPGELCVAGYLLCKGYYRDEENTKAAMRRDENGVLWMHTGDQVTIDADGYCRVTGRIKDIIIRGGENIAPQEIENHLLEHPSIIQASVIGVQHSRLGEVVGAFLAHHPEKPRPTLDDIRSHVRAKLGAHKAPEHVFWLGDDGVVDALPVTGSGKVRKDQLRNIANALVKET